MHLLKQVKCSLFNHRHFVLVCRSCNGRRVRHKAVRLLEYKMNKLKIISLIIFTSLIIGCGTTNYVLKNATPSLNIGFFNFRWTTPMTVIDSEFPKLTGAKQRLDLNRFEKSCFVDASFLDEITSLCEFNFDEKGLKSVKLVINSNQFSNGNKLEVLKEKLTRIYGEPNKSLGITGQGKTQAYIVYFSWAGKRLELMLMQDYSIEINAYGYSPIRGINR